MRYRCNSLCFQICDRFDDLVAELDSADALVTLLNTRWLAVDFYFEPDAADAGGLHRKTAGLTGNACVGLVAADHRVQGPMPADFFIDDDIDMDVALGLHARRQKAFHCHDMAGDAALHVG